LGNEKMQVGEKIWLIEKEKDSLLGIEHLAREAGTIPYEFLVKLEKGIRREVE
jgi:alanine racemase